MDYQITPPLGLAYLAGMLKKENKDYDVLDLRGYYSWEDILITKLKNYKLAVLKLKRLIISNPKFYKFLKCNK